MDETSEEDPYFGGDQSVNSDAEEPKINKKLKVKKKNYAVKQIKVLT